MKAYFTISNRFAISPKRLIQDDGRCKIIVRGIFLVFHNFFRGIIGLNSFSGMASGYLRDYRQSTNQ